MKKKVFFTLLVVALMLFMVVGYWKPDMEEIIALSSDVLKSSAAMIDRSSHNHQLNVPGKLNLAPKMINGVKKFVFFVGYSRSGHSIIGTLMDAHPHVIIAHEFYIFNKFRLLDKTRGKSWKHNLFDTLYQKSIRDVTELRANPFKGYTLCVEGLWQGKFDEYIEVLGDKGGGHATIKYLENKEEFKRNYRKLQKELFIPIRIIHALRNPYDMIATNMAMRHAKSKFLEIKGTLYSTESIGKEAATDLERINATIDTNEEISSRFNMFDAVVEMVDLFGKENVLEVHNCDLVNDPRGTISRIFDFLEVETSTHYLDVCSEKVFKSVSRSRDLIEWTPEQREMVARGMKKYPMLNRYTFTSD